MAPCDQDSNSVTEHWTPSTSWKRWHTDVTFEVVHDTAYDDDIVIVCGQCFAMGYGDRSKSTIWLKSDNRLSRTWIGSSTIPKVVSFHLVIYRQTTGQYFSEEFTRMLRLQADEPVLVRARFGDQKEEVMPTADALREVVEKAQFSFRNGQPWHGHRAIQYVTRLGIPKEEIKYLQSLQSISDELKSARTAESLHDAIIEAQKVQFCDHEINAAWLHLNDIVHKELKVASLSVNGLWHAVKRARKMGVDSPEVNDAADKLLLLGAIHAKINSCDLQALIPLIGRAMSEGIPGNGMLVEIVGKEVDIAMNSSQVFQMRAASEHARVVGLTGLAIDLDSKAAAEVKKGLSKAVLHKDDALYEHIMAQMTESRFDDDFINCMREHASVLRELTKTDESGDFVGLGEAIRRAAHVNLDIDVINTYEKKLHELKQYRLSSVFVELKNAIASRNSEAFADAISRAQGVDDGCSEICEAEQHLCAMRKSLQAQKELREVIEHGNLLALRSTVESALSVDPNIEEISLARRKTEEIEKTISHRLSVAMTDQQTELLNEAIDLAKGSGFYGLELTKAEERLKYLELAKAKERYFWKAYVQFDKVFQGDTGEHMDANDIEAVKSRIVEMGYSGFSVYDGRAYLKKFDFPIKIEPFDYQGPDSDHLICICTEKEGQSMYHNHCSSQLDTKAEVKVDTKHGPEKSDLGCQIVWEYSGKAHWTAFPPKISKGVEWSFLTGQATASFRAHGTEYELNFDNMKQYQMKNPGCSRKVRRHFIPPEVFESMWNPFVSRIHVQMHYGSHVGHVSLHSDVDTCLPMLVDHYVARPSRCGQMLKYALPIWRGVDADASLVLAAASLAILILFPTEIRTLTSIVFICSDGETMQSWDAALKEAHENLQDLAGHRDYRAVLQSRCGYSWLRRMNDLESRLARLGGACLALHYVALRCPEGVDKMLKGTELLDHDDLQAPIIPQDFTTKIISEPDMTLVDAALSAAAHHNVAAVSAASAYHVGGGLLSGGRHALEEAICMQSTLYFSLALAAAMAKERRDPLCDSSGRPIHIPEKGCVLSRGVEVIRHGTDRGYSVCEDAVRLAAILSVAMPNRNYHVTDSPVDLRRGFEYRTLLEKKFEAVVLGAKYAGADVLVIPDCGCGVFKNDPTEVGEALGRVLKRKKGYFKKIILVGSKTFARAVCAEYYHRRNSY